MLGLSCTIVSEAKKGRKSHGQAAVATKVVHLRVKPSALTSFICDRVITSKFILKDLGLHRVVYPELCASPHVYTVHLSVIVTCLSARNVAGELLTPSRRSCCE